MRAMTVAIVTIPAIPVEKCRPVDPRINLFLKLLHIINWKYVKSYHWVKSVALTYNYDKFVILFWFESLIASTPNLKWAYFTA